MKLYFRLIVFVLFTVGSLTVWVLSQSTERKEERENQQGQTTIVNEPSEFEKDYKRIEDLSAARSFQPLLDFSGSLKEKWGKDIKAYSILQAEISKAFASYDFQDKRQYIYSVEIAKDVLKNADKIPIQLEYEMVGKLQSNSAYLSNIIPGEKWEQDRDERILFLLHFWNRFQKSIDSNFDFNDLKNRPIGNVPVPAPNYMPGIKPENVKEPEIRAKYEEAIEANKQKAFKYNEQVVLHRIDKQLNEFIEKFLINLYSEPPFDIVKINNLIKSLKIEDLERKERILKAITDSKQSRNSI